MSYLLAIATFLVGAALGVTVARRRSIVSSQSSASSDRVLATVQSAATTLPVDESPEITASPHVDSVLTRALNALTIGVVLVDVDGRTIFRNSAASTISGIRHIDALVDEAVAGLIRTSQHHERQHRRFDSAGSPARSFDIRTERLFGGVTLATIEDVTEQARIDTVRTDFVANLSHELKTPIGGIAALADTMVGETDQEVLTRLASRIVDESYRLSRIVDDLLDLSRIEFGGTDDWEPVSMQEVVSEVVAHVQHEATRAGVTIQSRVDSGALVLGDRMQLVSALVNLVSNAVKYSGDGKIVNVEVRSTPETVRIDVVDKGIGIAAKDHQRIFERFYRVDRARSRSTGGSGLGLSIVRHIVSNHGGTISVVSQEGRGSTFSVVLPQAAGSPTVRDRNNGSLQDVTA